MKIIEFVINLVYPNVCAFCGDINKEYICVDCSKKIQKYQILKIEQSHNKYVNKQAFVYRYEGEIRKAILEFKFQEKAYIYKAFAKLILENLRICEYIKEYDVILPVPIHRKRLLERGYNQSELIVKEIEKYLKVKAETTVLIKTKNNQRQSSLNVAERKRNVKGVYDIKNFEKIEGKKILIIDDIFTTGNTVYECAKQLKKHNACEVGVLTIAKD